MLHNRSLIVVSVLLLSLTGRLASDEPKKVKEEPEDIARKALAALKENKLEDFAKEMHPSALKQLKTILLSVFDAAAEEGQEKAILALFSGARTVDEVKKLDDEKFFVSFLRGVIGLKPELKNAFSSAKGEVLGHVMEGEDTAHVVYRMTMSVSGATITKMDVMTLKKTDSGWRMMLSGEIDGLAQVLKQKFDGKK